MIVIEHLSKSFGTRVVLNDISLSVDLGECVFVLGKSGVGKSVLLKHIVGLEEPDQGTIRVGDWEVKPGDSQNLTQVRQTCGLVFQFPALLDSVTVFENICFGLRARGLLSSQEKIVERVKEKIRLVGVDESILGKFPNQLNFGLQKKISIARTLAVEPKYILFDEPTTGMDPVATAGLNRLITDLNSKLEVASIVVSHDINSALAVADRIVLLENGSVVFDGTPDNFKTCQVDLARQFLSGVQQEKTHAD